LKGYSNVHIDQKFGSGSSAFLVLPVEQRDRGTGASIERPPAESEAPHQLSAE
jgi:hypothetical protein